MDGLVPVNKGLKDELTHYGEFVQRDCYIDPATGTLWKKQSDGSLTEITKDPQRVLRALEHYGMNVEKKRTRCTEGRREWFRE